MRKILVLGHARHGKDTVAEMIASYLGESYKASSEICASFVREAMLPDYVYRSSKECFEDRVNHRAKWHSIIKEYCRYDKAKLGALIFKDNLIYCGIRDTEELNAVLVKFKPLVIWVDASHRMPPESPDSMNISYRAGWSVVSNNFGVLELQESVEALMDEYYVDKWTKRFTQQAHMVATYSKDPDCKVGCVIVSPDKNEQVIGYNGLPRGVDHAGDKLAFTIHAELNAILNARRDLRGWTLYTTKPPCTPCATTIAQVGISKVVTASFDESSSWHEDQVVAKQLLEVSNVDYVQLRDDTKRIN